jgi:AhpD family alkylhydroperoxidase
MTDFPNHDRQSAPAAALPSFDAAEGKFGMIPNLARKMATAPALLEAYLQVGALFDTTSLTPQERQVVLLTVSRENGCDYCMGAHSVLADMSKVPEAVTAAIREDGPIPDPRLAALNRFTRGMVQQRGWVPEEELRAFLDAGFDRQQVLEVVLGVGMKTLSNYTNHIAGTTLDEAFAHRAWEPPNA